ncbi:helix-turn-helix domain-containing protein [Nocardia asteroides]|uniref:helix-turn-helix domain-containing protein n=1 Tax=Nocardia asteroides TaxID=1824 RepID=UPI0033E66ADE
MTTWFRRTSEAEALFAEERLLLSATEMVHGALDAKGMSKKRLAELLDVTPTEVSQRLSGRRSLTLRSLARMMHVLGYRVRLDSALHGAPGLDAVGARVRRAPHGPRRFAGARVVGVFSCLDQCGQHQRPSLFRCPHR